MLEESRQESMGARTLSRQPGDPPTGMNGTASSVNRIDMAINRVNEISGRNKEKHRCTSGMLQKSGWNKPHEILGACMV
jgi:hypothetical protein